MFCGLASMFCGLTSMFCGGQICSVVAEKDIKPLFHTKNSNFIMILDVLSVLSVLSVFWFPEMFFGLFCASLNMQIYYKSSYIRQKLHFKIICGLASMFCGGQICSVVARNDIKPLFHT
jgi:F0F1-type ATP synthase membrane subunit c/vacuolar-type H+-ATPase subunit K